jgi:hypothetical protein
MDALRLHGANLESSHKYYLKYLWIHIQYRNNLRKLQIKYIKKTRPNNYLNQGAEVIEWKTSTLWL